LESGIGEEKRGVGSYRKEPRLPMTTESQTTRLGRIYRPFWGKKRWKGNKGWRGGKGKASTEEEQPESICGWL